MKAKDAAPANTDQYIAGFPPAVRSVLKRVRTIIRRAVPGAEEMISYKIPAFKLHGRPMLYFAAWKEHYSLYPSTSYLLAALKGDLAPYVISKGTIRFPFTDPVPARLIKNIAKLRAREIREQQKGRISTR
jgi:uncharacterized protein YdhG (YjbR/CyaY superfamily)